MQLDKLRRLARQSVGDRLLSLVLDRMDQNDAKLNWWALSKNPNITMNHIQDNPNLPWEMIALIENANLTMDFVLRHYKEYTTIYSWYTISQNDGITMQDIKSHPNLPWEYSGISANRNLRLHHVISDLDRDWCWMNISKNNAIRLDDIIMHPELPWQFEYVSLNTNLTIQFVLAHPDKPWNLERLSNNPAIDINDIIKHNFYWSMDSLHHNHIITMKHVLERDHWLWDYSWLSLNPGITIQDMRQYPERPWDWEVACRNPNISIDDIKARPPENVYNVVVNTFDREYLHMVHCFQHMMAFRIQLYWRKYSRDPTYVICRRVQLRRI